MRNERPAELKFMRVFSFLCFGVVTADLVGVTLISIF